MVTLVALVYAAVVGIGALFGRSGPPGLLLSIVATAVVALAFEPVRVRTRDRLLRLTHRERVPAPQAVLAHFTDTAGGRHPARELPDRIASTLAEGTQARRAEVWLVVSDRLELAASWPDRDPLPDAGGSPADRVSLEVRERGELFGRADRRHASGAVAEPGRATAVRGPRRAVGPHAAGVRPPHGARAAAGRAAAALRRSAPLPPRARRPAGRRATAAGAQHPRRGAAGGHRPAGEPAAGADPAGPGARARHGAARAAGGGDAGDHPDARRTLPRPLPGGPLRHRGRWPRCTRRPPAAPSR